ncbi:unnamed protein product [Litomosoides sigmodontis]|uniref:TAR DNA-binding protein 43 N-terminal domain-containing protein n=1 Tax=Litomosoides sigmodontis TaxID=42156 RepID=A0A3P6TQS8_LITSI|nr:unnamed protein product [Litomosoides sigmodontis]
MDVPPVIDSTSPPPGWARIELEPVDVPLQEDDSVLLSAVQSVIPGAHGLYYKEENCKKALKYNGATGCISKGPQGWNSKPIFVELAHGCQHSNSISAGQYCSATERFEKTVHLIQRMLGKSDQWILPHSHRKDASARSLRQRYGGGRLLSSDAQIIHEGECDVQNDEEERSNGSLIIGDCSKTSTESQKLQAQGDILKQRVKDLEIMSAEVTDKAQLLANLNAELNTEFENLSLGHLPEIEYDSLEQWSSEGGVAEKNCEIDEMSKQIKDLEWSLSEYRQWLKDTNKRANHLENVCKEKDYEIADVTDRLSDLEQRLIDSNQSNDNLNSVINDLRKEIDGKNDYIGQLEKAKNDAQWYLGEHQRWLQDANARIDVLENEKLEGWRKACEFEEMLKQAGTALTTSDCNNEMEEMQQMLEEKRRECEELKKENDETKVAISKCEARLNDAENRMRDMQDKESEQDRLIAVIIKELDDLKEIRNGAFRQLHAKLDELELHLNGKQQPLMEAELNSEDFKYKSVKDLAENISDFDNDHFNDSIEQRNCASWTIAEHKQWLQNLKERMKGMEKATQRVATAKDVMERHEIQQLEHDVEELKKEMLRNDQQIVQLEEDFNGKQNELKIDELESKLQVIGDENASLRREIETLRGNVSESMEAIEGLQKEVDDKNEQINCITKQKKDAEWNFDEKQRLLKDADNRINELKSALIEKSSFIEELKKRKEERFSFYSNLPISLPIFILFRCKLENTEEHASLREKLQTTEKALAEAPSQHKFNELSSAVVSLQNELNGKNECIKTLAKQWNDAEWILGEHRQWLRESNDRLRELEDQLCKRNDYIEQLRQEIGNRNADINKREMEMAKLRKDLDEKDANLVLTEKKRSDVEWFLVEERQRLKDANERISLLDEELTRVKVKHTDIVSNLRNETFMLREKELWKVIENLNNELHQSKAANENLLKERNDKEWQLEEHRGWLHSANDRITALEEELANVKEAGKRALEILRVENEALNEKNAQLEEDVKRLQDEIQNLLMNAAGEGGEETCWKFWEKSKHVLALIHSENIDEELRSINCLLENLCKELNYQKIIDTLMAERSTAEKLLEERNEYITDSYNKKAITAETLEEAENISRSQSLRSEQFINFHQEVENIRQQLSDRNAEVENLVGLKCELERNLKEAIIRKRLNWLSLASFFYNDTFVKLMKNEKLTEKLGAVSSRHSCNTRKNEEMSALLEQKERIIDAITQEKNAIAVESNSLEQQIDNLKHQCQTAPSFASNEGQNATELMVRLCERENLLQHLTTEIAEKMQEIVNLHNVIEDLRNVINEKNRIIDDLNKITSEKEWNLGEHRQWLTDANTKISILEAELNDARQREKTYKVELDRLANEIDEKNAKISQLHDKIAKMEEAAVNFELEKEMMSNEDEELK